jgi:hypothetical protein
MLKMEEEKKEEVEEPLQKPKKPRTEKQKEATQKMLLGRMEAKKFKNEIIAPLADKIKSIKKSKPKDLVIKPIIKPIIEEEEEEEEEEEIVIVKKKKVIPKKKKVIYVEEDDTDEEEKVKKTIIKKKMEVITPQVVPNKYVIKFI